MKILKNYLYNASYQLFIILVPIITVPYISRTLGPDGVGTYAFTNSIMTYFILLGNVGLSLYGNRTIAYYRNDKKAVSQKFYEIAFLKLVMMLLSLVIFFIFLGFYQKYTGFLLAQATQLIAIGFDISWFFVGMEDFKKTVMRNLVIKILSLALIFIFVKQPTDLTLYILIIGLSTVFGNLALWPYMRKLVVKVSLKALHFKEHLKPVFALFVPQLAMNVFITLNRILLGSFSTLTQTAYFDNSDKIVRIFLAFMNAFGIVLFPRIANYYKENKQQEVFRYVRYGLQLVSLFSFPIAFGTFVVAKPFSDLFFGSQYQGIEWVLGILVFELIFMGWSSMIGSQYLVAINEVKGVTVSMMVALVVSGVGSYFLIPKFGAIGAAMMSVVAEGVIITVQLFFTRQFLNLKGAFAETWKYFLASLGMFGVCSLGKLVFLPTSNILQILYLGLLGAITYVVLLFVFKPQLLMVALKTGKEKLHHRK